MKVLVTVGFGELPQKSASGRHGRQELRRDISEIRQNEQIEQPTLERLLSGNMGQVGQMPPELIRWGEGFGGSGVLLGLL